MAIDQHRLQGLIDELGEQGSAHDPIWLDGQETTPEDLAENPAYTDLRLVIEYFGGTSRPYKKMRGTLIQMVEDRGGDPSQKVEPEEPELCPYCGRPN